MAAATRNILVSVTFALALLVPGVKMGVVAVMLLSIPAQVPRMRHRL
jgi:hypothetical protein